MLDSQHFYIWVNTLYIVHHRLDVFHSYIIQKDNLSACSSGNAGSGDTVRVRPQATGQPARLSVFVISLKSWHCKSIWQYSFAQSPCVGYVSGRWWTQFGQIGS